MAKPESKIFDFDLGGYFDFGTPEIKGEFSEAEVDFLGAVLRDRVMVRMLAKRGINIRAVLRYMRSEEEIVGYLESSVSEDVMAEVAKHLDFRVNTALLNEKIEPESAERIIAFRNSRLPVFNLDQS